jgi:hypothetical protein
MLLRDFSNKHNNLFTGANLMKTTVSVPGKGANAAATAQYEREPIKLLERIGSTTVEVSIHFNKSSKETMEDKILRLIEREAIKNAD